MREIVRRQTVGRGRGIGALLGWAGSWAMHWDVSISVGVPCITQGSARPVILPSRRHSQFPGCRG